MGNLTGRSCHGNYPLWENGPKWLIDACLLSHSCLLSIFLSNSFSFLNFLLCFSLSCFVVFFGIVMFSPAFLFCSICSCARQRTLLYYLPLWVFTILPLNRFCLGVNVLLDHPLGYQLPNHHHLPILVVPHPITRQRVLFCLLAHCGIPIWIRVGILSHYPSWHAPSDSNSSFPLLGDTSSQ